MNENVPTRETDLVVIGAGPGGYSAAFAAADREMKVILVDAGEHPGGVCLNRGCIPSKTLLHIAGLINQAREAAGFGLKFQPPEIDLAGLRRWRDRVVGKNAAGVRQLARARGVEIVRAWARLQDSQTLVLADASNHQQDVGRVRFDKAILAVGSRPSIIPALDIDSPHVWDSTAALELSDLPASLLVIGGGYIGLEVGTIYAALGSEVTVVEMTDGLLPGADRDLVRVLQSRLTRTFKDILLSTKVTQMAETGSAVSVTFAGAGGESPAWQQSFDRVLLAVGRTPNSDRLGLEKTNVKVSARGFVEVDQQQRTADDHIYAIGDVAGDPMLAHKASRQAKVAVEAIAGEPAAFEPRAIPAVVFTDPEIAWAGLTETRAAQRGIEVQVSRFPWGASGRATAIGRNDGLTKIIVAPDSKRILGVGIVGVGAGELIAEGVLAIGMGATARDLAASIHAHPTLSETVGEAAELAFGTATHLYRPPR